MKILLILALLLLSSCFQSSKFDSCDRENEKLVRVDGGEKCLPQCLRDSQCATGDVCVSSVCAPAGSILSIVSPDKPEPGADVGTQDSAPDVLVSEDEAEKACADLVQRSVECTKSQCTIEPASVDAVVSQVEGILDSESCKRSYETDADFRASLGRVSVLDCGDPGWKFAYCRISLGAGISCDGCQPSRTVGDACLDNPTCESGDFGTTCFTKSEEIEFPGGYCLAECGDIDPAIKSDYFYLNEEHCGDGNSCIVFVNDDSRAGRCFQGCLSHDDCRAGYVCGITSTQLDRVCRPASPCDPASCGPSERCGIENGPAGEDVSVCQFECASTPEEEACTSVGGTCKAANGDDKRYCVLP